jgi:hypothetical protein
MCGADWRLMQDMVAGGVEVRSGVVTLNDSVGDPNEQHVVTVMAASVRGVVDVRIARTGD